MDFKQILTYLQGSTTQQERNSMIEWIEESEANRMEFAALRRVYDASLLMEGGSTAVAKPKYRWLKWAAGLSIATAIAIIAGLNLSRPQRVGTPQAPQLTQTFSTLTSHQSKAILSDGTVVWLNSGSELTFTEIAGGERRVKLQGEAYLEVSKDENRPFIVETSSLEVRVHGTKFNVNAYDSEQSVVLVEGSVSVKDMASGNSTMMHPDEMFTFNTSSGERSIRPVNSDKYISWTQGYFLLDKIPMKEVLTRLEQFYGVQIEFDVEQASWIPISGKLELRNGIEAALGHLALLAPLEYSISDDGNITISKK